MGAEVVEKSGSLTLKKKSALSAVKIPMSMSSKGAVEAAMDKPETQSSPGAAAAIIEKSKIGMKESSAKLSAEKAKSAKEEKAAAAAAAFAGSEADKPKEKKSSTSKIGSLKLNPSALASVLGDKKDNTP
jgi:hypothetical protein